MHVQNSGLSAQGVLLITTSQAAGDCEPQQSCPKNVGQLETKKLG